MNVDIAALRAIEADKDIPFETVLEAIESALLTAYKHTEGRQPHARIDIDRKTGYVRVIAYTLDENGEVVEEWDDTPEGFGRIAAATARQVILQRLRDAEHEKTYGEFSAQEGEIVAGVVQRDAKANARGMVIVQVGDTEGVLPAAEQVPRAVARAMRGKGVRRGVSHARGYRSPCRAPIEPGASCSLLRSRDRRRHCRITAVARRRARSKIAVRSTVPGVNAKGACIGHVGARVRNVMSELGGEKIDIIDHSDDPARFVGNALSPAKVVSVDVVDERTKTARVIVPDFQLSLAIGKEGQNARLAARLTGWRIDIRSDAAPEPGEQQHMDPAEKRHPAATGSAD